MIENHTQYLDWQQALLNRSYTVTVDFHVDAEGPGEALSAVRHLLVEHGLDHLVSHGNTTTVDTSFNVSSWVGTRFMDAQ